MTRSDRGKFLLFLFSTLFVSIISASFWRGFDWLLVTVATLGLLVGLGFYWISRIDPYEVVGDQSKGIGVKTQERWATGLLMLAGLLSLGVGSHEFASDSNNGTWNLVVGVVFIGCSIALIVKSRRHRR